MKTVRLGLIGAGWMANRVHYPSLAEFPDVEMAALCDLVPEKLDATARKFRIPRTYDNHRKMLDEVRPDAVYVLMPPHHVFDVVVECLERKLHVFIEKPPGLTAQQTRSMALLAAKNRCLTMTGFQRRFCPIVVEARRRVEERGPIVQCGARYIKSTIGNPPYFNGAIDVLTCDAIHAVDILRWMGGEVKTVCSDVRRLYADYDNAFNALLKFESGAVGILMTNWAAGRRIYSVEMHGKGISAFVEPDDKAVVYRDNNETGDILPSREFAGSADDRMWAGFFAENRHFIDCILKGETPSSNFSDAVKTMELVEAIYRDRI